MKRIVLVLAVVCLVLAGCGQGEAVPSSGGGPVASGAFSEPEKEGVDTRVSGPSKEDASALESDETSSQEKPVNELVLSVPCQEGDSTSYKELKFSCPEDWKEDGVQIRRQDTKLVECSASSLKLNQGYLEKLNIIEEKTMGDKKYQVYFEEYTILNQMTKVFEEYIIWGYIYLDEAEQISYNIRLFQRKDDTSGLRDTFETVLASMEVSSTSY